MKKLKFNSGFTLIEIMFSLAISVSMFIGILSLMIYCLDLQETAKNTTEAMNNVRQCAEDEIRSRDFDAAVSYFSAERTFSLDNLNGFIRVTIVQYAGLNFVPGSDSRLANIRIVASWLQRNGRIIGEGRINAGTGLFELFDSNSNGQIDSPVELIVTIYKKT